MQLHTIDILIFLAFIAAVVSIGILTSRRERDSEAYFLAGRGLPWWLIGFSLIAANISTEQFVGMSGNAADRLGLAIASYEWLAAVTLVGVAFFILPYFLRAGIYTIPEFLEQRYNRAARSVMAVCMVSIYVLLVGAVTYSGALTLQTAFAGARLPGGIPVNVVSGAWLIGLVAAAYVASGGLKACAWADLLQGSALIAGGGAILYFALEKLGAAPLAALASTAPMPAGLDDGASGVAKFAALNAHKLHMVLPRNDPFLPWTTLLLGLWIPNLYYWGLNQYIMQRALGSRSLAEGQKGIVFAALMKLLIPFVIVMPGMMAFNLYSGDMKAAAERDNARVIARWEEVKTASETAQVRFEMDAAWRKEHVALAGDMDAHNARAMEAARSARGTCEEERLTGYKYDTAFGHLIRRVLPEGSGWQGFVLAALLGAVVSTLAAMLNAASTILTMDIYRVYCAPAATQRQLVLLGRVFVGLFMVVGCWIAPRLGDPRTGSSIFAIIQESQAYIYSGILAVFLVGILVRRAPPVTGVLGLVTGPVSFWLIGRMAPGVSFVDRASFSFIIALAVMLFVTWVRPLREPVVFRSVSQIDLRASRSAKVVGLLVLFLTLALYVRFW